MIIVTTPDMLNVHKDGNTGLLCYEKNCGKERLEDYSASVAYNYQATDVE